MRIDDRALDLAAEEGARAVALGLLAEASEAARALAAGRGDEPLHDFRVGLRRLRSTLRAFRPWLEGGIRPRHEKRLRKIARSTNEARDAEVQLAWLATARKVLTAPGERAGLDLFVARLEARAHRGPDAARVAARFLAAAEGLERRLGTCGPRAGSDAAGRSFGMVLAALVVDHAAALSAAMGAVRDASDEEAIHRARIEGKRLRYLLEPLRGHRRADAAEAIDRLKRLQDLLGELHDAHALAHELRAAHVDVAVEGARKPRAGSNEPVRSRAEARRPRGAGPRSGLLALLRLATERRDALYADLRRGQRRGDGTRAIAAEAKAVADALEARAARRTGARRRGTVSTPAAGARAARPPSSRAG